MQNQNWFQDWFDSKYYHILYQHRNEEEAEEFINNLIHFLQLKPNNKVLDLACGQGRHSYFLSQKEFHVLGLDLAANSIANAKKNYNAKNLEFAVHDMRKVYKNNAFDAVFNFFTSFGYFDDFNQNQIVFNTVEKQLKKGGLFVLDYLNTTKAIKNLKKQELKQIQGIDFYINKWVANQKIYKQIQFTDQNQKFEFTEEVADLSLDHFKSFGIKSNLQLLDTFGNYNLEKFDLQTSNRLILIFKKP